MGTAICCVDDSEGSRDALRIARRLAERLDLELVLLNVAPPTEAPGVSAAVSGQERLHAEELRDAQQLLDRVALDEGLGPEVRRRAEIGPAADRILAVCREEQPELVLMGSRGRGELKAALLGSVSSKVASGAPCPCVIVPPDARERRFFS
jgi:nucleotide-binding universal stress UspA family protein